MKRIIMHWTAGGNTPSNLDRGHYHFLIDGAGKVHKGTHPVEANRNPVKGRYAAHTLNCNTGAIGVAVCAMAGAVERPFNAGSAPITPAQVKALAALLRDLCAQYKIPITRETVLSHAEVQPTLGIKQKGKWDIAWLPGMKAPGDPVAVGDKIRAMVAGAKAPVASEPVAPAAITKLGYKSVKDFQGAYGLEVDGIVGPKTRAAMNKALAEMAAEATKKPAKPAKPKAALVAKKKPADAGGLAGGAVGGGLVLGIVAFADDLWRKFAEFADWITFWNN